MAMFSGPPALGTYIKQRRVTIMQMREMLTTRTGRDIPVPRGHAPQNIVVPRVNAGRWIADCPALDCAGAEIVSTVEPRFYCFSCCNKQVEGRTLAVVFPDDMDAIERALLERPHADFMDWWPGIAVEELRIATEFHRSWTAPRTWVTGETVNAPVLNIHVRGDLDALSVHEHTGAAGDGADILTLAANN